MGAPENDATVAPIIKVSGNAVLTFRFQDSVEMQKRASGLWSQRSAPQREFDGALEYDILADQQV
jgi:hypothetical protein